MKRRKPIPVLALLRGLLLASLLGGATAAVAAPCAGFVDVDSTDPGCASVEWLKNRLVTLGCATPNSYCPADAVIRLSMAAFLNRLGLPLSPNVLYHEASGASLDLDSPPATICATAAATISGYPRQAAVTAAFTARTGATFANVDLRLVQSTNGGATWTQVTTNPATAGGASEWTNAGTWKTGIALAVGTSYQFGLRATRATSAPSTGDLLAWNCQLKVVMSNRTGSASPF